MDTSIEIDFYYRVLNFLREIKRLSLLSEVIAFTFASDQDPEFQLLNRCEKWELVEIINIEKDGQDSKLVVSVIPTKKSDKVRQKIEKVMDDPFLTDTSRIKALKKLLRIKKQNQEKVVIEHLNSSQSEKESELYEIIPKTGKYAVVRRMAKKFIEDNKVDNWKLAACITPTASNVRGGSRKFAKKDYERERYDRKIKNCFITLRKLWEPIGYTVKFHSHLPSELVKI